MKIQDITSSHSNDFSAILECEHCAKTQRLTTGYNDAFYHNRVLPSIKCHACGLDRDGRTEGNLPGVNGAA